MGFDHIHAGDTAPLQFLSIVTGLHQRLAHVGIKRSQLGFLEGFTVLLHRFGQRIKLGFGGFTV